MPPGLDHRFGHCDIVAAGDRITGGVIMDKDQPRRAEFERALYDLPRIDRGGVDRCRCPSPRRASRTLRLLRKMTRNSSVTRCAIDGVEIVGQRLPARQHRPVERRRAQDCAAPPLRRTSAPPPRRRTNPRPDASSAGDAASSAGKRAELGSAGAWPAAWCRAAGSPARGYIRAARNRGKRHRRLRAGAARSRSRCPLGSTSGGGKRGVRRVVESGRAGREHLAPGLGDADRMLELRRQRAVARHGRPAVVEQLDRRDCPRLIIGSMVKIMPGRSTGPFARACPTWTTFGASWNTRPTPWPQKSRTTE